MSSSNTATIRWPNSGGVHLACEQASNVLTKVLEWGRLMAYLEQSTRYIVYDSRLGTGHYRYYRDPDVLDSPLGARFVGDMDRMFDTYATLLPELQTWLVRRFPRQSGDSDFVHRQSIRAKALDALRGLLPAGSLSNVGIYGTGQSYEMLLLRMRSHPLPEARRYADLMLVELRKVIPSFLQRVDLADRGGVWSRVPGLHPSTDTDEVVGRLWPDRQDPGADTSALSSPSTTGIPRARTRSSPPSAFPTCPCPNPRLCAGSGPSGPTTGAPSSGPTWGSGRTVGTGPVGPSNGPTTASTIVSDYGAFRDLQRHRMLSIEWQPLTPFLGYDVPEIVDESGLADAFDVLVGPVPGPLRDHGPDLPRPGALCRGAGLPHPLRHADERA